MQISSGSFIQDKNAYRKSLEERLGEFSSQIHILDEKTDQLPATTQTQFKQDIQHLLELLRVAAEKMNTIENAHSENWENVKNNTEQYWQEFKKEILEVAARFQRNTETLDKS